MSEDKRAVLIVLGILTIAFILGVVLPRSDLKYIFGIATVISIAVIAIFEYIDRKTHSGNMVKQEKL